MDPESVKNMPLPAWLSILISKYLRETQGGTQQAGKTSTRNAGVDSVGRFSCFLSCCVDGTVTCSDQERNALLEVSDIKHCLLGGW